MLDDDNDNPNTIEAELAIPKRSEGELAFEVAGVEFGLELEQLRNGKVALTVEAERANDDEDDDDDDGEDDDGPDDDGYRFVFDPNDSFEDSFEIEVAGKTYLIDVEAGVEADDDDDDEDDEDDEDADDDGDGDGDEVEAPELVAEIEVTPRGRVSRAPLDAEFEIEAPRGKEVDGEFEYRDLVVELGLEQRGALGRHYVLEVEIEDDRTGRSYEREFHVNTRRDFEREFELSFGVRDFELEIEVEREREDDAIVASLEIERVFGAGPSDDVLL